MGVLRRAGVAGLLAVASCATYTPPPPAPPQSFSRTINGSYDRTWSAITYVAGASFFKIKAFEKASGLMTLDFELKDVGPYVDCGTNAMGSTTLPALTSSGLDAVSLQGTANITVRSEGPGRTAVQFNSRYELGGYTRGGYGGLVRVASWSFTTGTADTQKVAFAAMTCRPSYKIERDFLTEITARL